MLKIINQKEHVLDELIDGIMDAEPNKFVRVENQHSYTLHKKDIKDDRVQIIISGGGGYGPLFPGFVGDGLADAVCHGDFDCAPNAYAIYEVAKKIHRGKGIFFLTNNFAGDFLNNDMAQELLLAEGIKSKVCYVSDDVFSAKGEGKENRGGLFGVGLLMKIAAKLADQGATLDEMFRVVEKANDRLRTATFVLNEKDGKMELGAGFSNEPPVVIKDFKSASDMAEQVTSYLLNELKDYPTSNIYFSINRMYKMTYVEGYVVLNSVKKALESKGYNVAGCSVGSYFNAFNEKGCIISVLAADEELDKYIGPISGYDFTI